MTEQPGSRTVLIAGASGVIGAAAIEHFAQLPGWKVIGVSRRPADVSPDVAYEHVAVDLTDPAACRAAAERFAGVTHVVYAALFEKPGLVPGWREQDQMQTNLAMMRNLMDPAAGGGQGARPCQRAAGHQGLWGACASDQDPLPREPAARPA